MADLRALLGSKCDETIETAAHALDAAWNPERYPVLAAMFRDYAHDALAAVLPGLLADAWDEAVASMRYEDGTPVQLVSVVNPYRPETATRDATDAPVTLAAPDAINPPPNPSAAVTEPHNTEGA